MANKLEARALEMVNGRPPKATPAHITLSPQIDVHVPESHQDAPVTEIMVIRDLAKRIEKLVLVRGGDA